MIINLETTIEISDLQVKQEFYKRTERFHIIACWVGVALNLVWFASDYFVLPEFFLPFLIFRLSVSTVSAAIVALRKKLKMNIYVCMFILILGISVQNAFMWSVMDMAHFQKHAFAYMALFICAGMLVLWELKYSLILLLATIISNIIFYQFNCSLSVEGFVIGGGLITLTVAVASVFMIRQRYRLALSEIRSRLEVELSKKIIEEERNTIFHQKKEIEEKNEEITSSIRYAKRIQQALLPSTTTLDSLFNEAYFVFFQPRDIVSGDFYWAKKIKTTPSSGESRTFLLLAVADCTGHGVPGAFMSLIGANFLTQSSSEKNINTPAEALDFLNKKISSTLNHGGEEKIRDGMDISFIAIDPENNTAAFSGANNSLYIIRDGLVEIVKPNKQAIGNINDDVLPFTNNHVKLQPNDRLFLFTDGYADQFGGNQGKKLTRKKFQGILVQSSTLPMIEQKKFVEKSFNDWKGTQSQTDDVCVIGIKI